MVELRGHAPAAQLVTPRRAGRMPDLLRLCAFEGAQLRGETLPLDAQAGAGGKLGFDATRTPPEEQPVRDWPDPLKMSPQIRDLVNGRWQEYGL